MRIRYLAALLSGAAGMLCGQPSPLVLRSTTRVVQISAVIRDKSGNAVPGLQQSDFQLFDEGKPQKISFFQQELHGALPVSAEPLAPNTFTNRLSRQASVPSAVTVILLDAHNTKLSDQIYAKGQVLKYLRTIRPEDHIGLYVLDNALHVLHDYTVDARDLLADLAAYSPKSPLNPIVPAAPPPIDVADRELAQLTLNQWLSTNKLSSNERNFLGMQEALLTLEALETIANHLASVPGRKNLVWVSGGFSSVLGLDDPSGPRGRWNSLMMFTDQIGHTVRVLSDANVAVYPVDAGALTGDPIRDGSVSYSSHVQQDPTQTPPPPPGSRQQDTMIELAARTGGHAYRNRMDFDSAVRDAIEDASLTYTLGFYPQTEAADGKFHKLKLKVDRAGLTMRYRDGYYDSPPAALNAAAAERELSAAVWSPLDSTSIPLVVQLQPLPETGRWNVVIRIDGSSIRFDSAGDRWKGKIGVRIVQKDDHGRLYNGIDNLVELNPGQKDYQKILTAGAVYRQAIEKNALASELRVVVRDAESGNIGSVTVPFSHVTR